MIVTAGTTSYSSRVIGIDFVLTLKTIQINVS